MTWGGLPYGSAPIASQPSFNDFRQAILDGLVSAQSEANGWNAQRSNIPVTAVVRTSDTVVTITLPALGSYDITADETITATIPAAALVGGTSIVATPTFTIFATVAPRAPKFVTRLQAVNRASAY